MRDIYLIATGGTLEKEYSEQLGVVVNNKSKVGRYLEQLRLPACEVRVISLMNKDSLEMTPEDRKSIVAEIEKLLSLECPIVITHGTDTMVESAKVIERSLSGLKVPIVLTGAMKPLGFERSDGVQNLTESLLAAQLLGPGVYIVFHGQVFPASQTRKDRERGTFVFVKEEEKA
jgi:L-asparaginase